jgi:predicted kinase
MEMVLLMGVQAAGKSTFCKQRFFDTHLRLNLDMLRTRNREEVLVRACLFAKQPFVVDNTNPTKADRARYIPYAKEARFRIVGYYLSAPIEEALQRNAAREKVIPEPGVRRTFQKIELPTFDEGFDELFYVRTDPSTPMGFLIEPWRSPSISP